VVYESNRSEQGIARGVKGSGHGIIWDAVPAFAQSDVVNLQKSSSGGFAPIIYRGALLSALQHAILYVVYTICWMY
jgi:hypothetical protein